MYPTQSGENLFVFVCTLPTFRFSLFSSSTMSSDKVGINKVGTDDMACFSVEETIEDDDTKSTIVTVMFVMNYYDKDTPDKWPHIMVGTDSKTLPSWQVIRKELVSHSNTEVSEFLKTYSVNIETVHPERCTSNCYLLVR